MLVPIVAFISVNNWFVPVAGATLVEIAPEGGAATITVILVAGDTISVLTC